jgi:magnesium transporter
VVTLTLFIPLLIGTGGNAGAQSATTIVRGMAMNDIRSGDLLRVVLREGRVGLLLGTMLGTLSVAPVWLFTDRSLALIIALTLVTVCTLASLVGSLMPLLARQLGVDPAVVSAPFVTTIVDATGLLVYFLIARIVLGI